MKSMKRRQLQALCKKHGLPANPTNSQMALSLASLLQKNEKIKLRGCLKGSDQSRRENSGPKKVSFSLEDEEFEFEKSLGSTRRASVGVIKADDDRKTCRVAEVPARVTTRSWSLEVLHLTASSQKRKGSCVVEHNLRILRNRVLIVSGNEWEFLGNQKLRRRGHAGKPKEDPKVELKGRSLRRKFRRKDHELQMLSVIVIPIMETQYLKALRLMLELMLKLFNINVLS